MQLPFLRYDYYRIKSELIRVISETIRDNAQMIDAVGRKTMKLSHVRATDGTLIETISLIAVNGEPSFAVNGDYYHGGGSLNLEDLYAIYNYFRYLQARE